MPRGFPERRGEESQVGWKCPARHAPAKRTGPCSQAESNPDQFSLVNEKDLVRIGIPDFRSWRETADIDIALIGSIRTGHEPWFIGHRNAIGNISPGLLNRARGRGNFG